jgi:hypothetical protein
MILDFHLQSQNNSLFFFLGAGNNFYRIFARFCLEMLADFE